MLAVRATLVVATVLVIGAAPLFVDGLGPPGGTPPAIRAAAAAGPHFDNDNDNDDHETEVEGQILPVQCPLVRGSEPGLEVACEEVPEGTVLPAITRDAIPARVYVHNLDGAVLVTLDDPAALDAFQEGDYVRIEGRRVHTFLFRGRAGSTDDNDND